MHHKRGSRKFCQKVREGPNLITVFFNLVDEGIEDQNTAINRPTSARQRKAIWRPNLTTFFSVDEGDHYKRTIIGPQAMTVMVQH